MDDPRGVLLRAEDDYPRLDVVSARDGRIVFISSIQRWFVPARARSHARAGRRRRVDHRLSAPAGDA